MPMLDVYDIKKNKVSEIEVNGAVFEADVNEAAVHDVVRLQLASKRAGTAAVKERSFVRGGGRKPFRQKGTGRARAGSTRSPIWRGGGIVFGPHPRDYSFSIPKKVRKAALKSVLTMKFRENKLLVLNDFPMDGIRTKTFKGVLDLFGLKSALFVLGEPNEIVEKSSRNLKEVKMMRSEGINVYDVLRYEHLVLMEPSVKMIEGAVLG
ncbi:MAG: 50S ribosomal protein L4 [Syntrophales bacterium]|nr:50S ribosomal protein L4 [Syntrophales bacterium]MDD5233545.1 50S ribosomal protein L4 [Syntrophales bacterium]MDD5531744.1 50S ribosomal protein L4 [Syntrophales bacterium]HPL63958.1 50S ribosomal protein L4 [Syntrophales bacterium]